MGLFSFLKTAGEKLFGGKKEAPAPAATAGETAAAERASRIAALRNYVTKLGIKVQNLTIDIDGEVVTVHGQTESQSEKEKLILALGNVHGVASVNDQVTVVTPEPEATMYEVKSGDTLSKISKQMYGDAMKYPVIFEANKPMLTHPDKIYPGQVLRIPPL